MKYRPTSKGVLAVIVIILGYILMGYVEALPEETETVIIIDQEVKIAVRDGDAIIIIDPKTNDMKTVIIADPPGESK